MLPIIYKLGLAVAATLMVFHSAGVAIKAARDAHQLWSASRAKVDGNRDR
jgi:hypothetical protein